MINTTIFHTRSYKCIIATILSTMIVVIGLSSVVRADTGLKPYCVVEVTNAPDDEYYIALLTNEWSAPVVNNQNDSPINYENEAIRYIEEYEDAEGYRLFRNFKEFYSPSNAENVYRFYGDAGVLPNTYKIMIVTMDGEVKVSPAISQKAFGAKMIYDYSSNTLEEDYSGIYVRCVPWVFVFVFVTLFCEGLILLVFNLFHKKNIVPFVVINAITQIILNVINIVWYLSGRASLYVMVWITAEIVITAIEALWYGNRLIKKDGTVSVKRNVIYAITANSVSALADLPIFLIMMFIPITRGGLW